MTELIKDKSEIEKIISIIKNKKIFLTRNYSLKCAKINTDEKRAIEILPMYDKVIAIEREKLREGDTGYELFYLMDNGFIFSIAL